MGYPTTRDQLEAAGFRFDTVGTCRGARCRAEIHWWFSPRGSRIPLNPDCTGHHTTCPDAGEFRRPDRKR